MAQRIRIALSGFGRIGRHLFRIAQNFPEYEIVGIRVQSFYGESKELTDRAHDLRNDPYYGVWEKAISVDTSTHELVVGNVGNIEKRVPVFALDNPTDNARWELLDADFLIECSGAYKKTPEVIASLAQCAKRVITTYPLKGIPHLIYGVNHWQYDAQRPVVSSGSCTTNCVAPILHPLLKERRFGLLECSGVTIHSATSSQDTLKTLEQIVNYTTGASKAVEEVLPQLRGKTNFSSFRVPTAQVSCVELSCVFDAFFHPNEVHGVLDRAAKNYLRGVLDITSVPKRKDRSGYYRRNSHSAIVNSETITRAGDGRIVKIAAWYDNEYAYSCRVIDLVGYIVYAESLIESEKKTNNSAEFVPEYIPRAQCYDDANMYGFPGGDDAP